jgi:hypothetical protein
MRIRIHNTVIYFAVVVIPMLFSWRFTSVAVTAILHKFSEINHSIFDTVNVEGRKMELNKRNEEKKACQQKIPIRIILLGL